MRNRIVEDQRTEYLIKSKFLGIHQAKYANNDESNKGHYFECSNHVLKRKNKSW